MHSPVTTGISFAILIATVGGAFAYVAANPVEDPWFGFRGSPLTAELAEAAGLIGRQGFLIMIVEPDSPAMAAGLMGGNRLVSVAGDPSCLGGDLVLEINGVPVTGVDEIGEVLEASKVGDTVQLRVLRGEGPPIDAAVTLANDPHRPRTALEEVCN
jgi:S1-C subfamily serine protease